MVCSNGKRSTTNSSLDELYSNLDNTIFFLIINLNNEAPFVMNATLIILSGLFLYYGILVVLTKNFIYYKYSKEKFARRNQRKYNIYLISGLFILFLLNRTGRYFPNELFALETISYQTEDLNLDTFVKQLPKNQVRYYIGSYGGGMKSNAWTLTVLNELYNKDPKFIDKTVVISGASGGTMGLINWSAIANSNQPDTQWQSMITQISTENILSLDLTHMLGRDTFNHMFVPGFDLKGFDRSTKAMLRYATLANHQTNALSSLSYRSYWNSIYSRYGHFPVLISNTTNIKGNQGMAASIAIDSSKAEYTYLYQNADNILDLITVKNGDDWHAPKKKTLSYYNAASTSNRFPLLSPAAKIESLGYFNDGGIYENSGMLSAYKFYRAVSNKEEKDSIQSTTQKNVFINIVNDKNAYIKKMIEDCKGEDALYIGELNKSTEINAIVGSIASTEMMPIYIKTELQRMADNDPNIEFKTIYLPHTFTAQDVFTIYGEAIDFGKGQEHTYNQLYECVKSNNQKIRSLISSSCELSDDVIVIEPPMSRVMSQQAYQFMQEMVRKDPLAKSTIQEIINVE